MSLNIDNQINKRLLSKNPPIKQNLPNFIKILYLFVLLNFNFNQIYPKPYSKVQKEIEISENKLNHSHKCGFYHIKHKNSTQLKQEAEENMTEEEKLFQEKLKKLQEKDNILYNSSVNINANSLNQRFLQFGFFDDFLEKEFQPIRIHYDYTTLNSQINSINSETINSIKSVLDDTKQMFENLISIKRYKSKLRIRNCDNSIKISREVALGKDTDVVIFPILDSSISETSVEAYATACAVSNFDNRPIAGLIGFNPNLNNTKTNWRGYYRNLALHELTHVLVFNPNLFDFFRDENNLPYNLYDVILIKTINGIRRNLLAYPKLLENAKRHFNCSTLEGVELENQGGQGTASAHWEARTLLGDFMIGLSFDDVSISEISLGLFEDSGWYKINYYTGGLFKFGKNQGCKMTNEKCVKNGAPISTKDFCVNSAESKCQTNLLGRGFCYLINDANPDNFNYMYFSNNKKGGLFLADYCPVIAAPSSNSIFYQWSCTKGISTYPKEFDEEISETSACFMSNLVKKNSDFSSKSYRATCYAHSCDYTNGILTIFIGKESVQCPIGGGEVEINDYEGKIICPDFYSICTHEIYCNDIYDCIIKKFLIAERTLDYSINYNKDLNNLPTQAVNNNQESINTKKDTLIEDDINKTQTKNQTEPEKIDNSEKNNTSEPKDSVKEASTKEKETKESLIENSFNFLKIKGLLFIVLFIDF